MISRRFLPTLSGVFFSALFLFLLFGFFVKPAEHALAANPPTVTTSAATSVATTSAVFNGSITNTGGSNATIVGFVFGSSTAGVYNATTSWSGSFGTTTFATTSADFTCGTTYHYAAFATNPAGTSYGADQTFTTSACPLFNFGSCPASTDLLGTMVAELNSRIAGVTLPANATTSVAANRSFMQTWATRPASSTIGNPAPFNFGGVATTSDLFTLISPRHFIGATHVGYSIGESMTFYNASGTTYTRTIVAVKPNIGGSDMEVGVLNADLPASVPYYPIVNSSDILAYSPITSVPLVFLNQNSEYMIRQANIPSSQSNSSISAFPSTSPFYPYGLEVNNSSSTNIYLDTIAHPGDSGHPSFFAINNNLFLALSQYTTTGGPLVGNYTSLVNQAMADIDQTLPDLGNGYQVTTLNMSSCFNYYTSTTIPTQTFSVNEFAPASTTVGTLQTASGDNVPTRTFSITGGNVNGAFSINSNTGVISVANSNVLNPDNSSFNLGILGTETWPNGTTDSIFGTSTLNVVNNWSWTVPIFASTTFYFTNPFGASGTTVGSVKAYSLTTPTYAIVSGNINNAFSIDSSGVIHISNASNAAPLIQPLIVSATEPTNGLTSTTTVSIPTTYDSQWHALGDTNGQVYASVFSSSTNTLYVGGSFTTAGGISANNIAAYNVGSGTWNALGPGVNSTVSALALSTTTNILYVGGSFSSAGGVASTTDIAAYNIGSSTWANVGGGLNNTVNAFSFGTTTNVLYVGGSFSSAGAIASTSDIAAYNIGSGTWSSVGGGTNNTVNALVFSTTTGTLYAGGSFSTAGIGVSASDIASYNVASSTWNALGSGLNSAAFSLALDSSGNVYVGGAFTTAGGITARRIAMYSPTSATWNALGTGMNSIVEAMAFDSSGNLYAGGYFTTAGSNTVSGIAFWNGNNWYPIGLSGLTGGGAYVADLAFDSSGNLYAGGSFTTAGGTSAKNIAIFTLNYPYTTFNYTAGANGSVSGGLQQFLTLGVSGNAIIATANSGYHFVNWSDGSTANPRTDTATSSASSSDTFTANFAVTVTPSYSGGGGGGGGGFYIPSTAASNSTTSSVVSTVLPVVYSTSKLSQSVITSTFLRDLETGDTGTDVKALQQYLNTHGYVITTTGPGSPGNETTLFGNLTKIALEKFQSDHGLPATGYFGPLTKGKMGKVAAPTVSTSTSLVSQVSATTSSSTVITLNPTFLRDLETGDTGTDVKALQQYLNTHGYVITTTGPGSPGNETTLFGNLTKIALEKFQSDHGLPATGYFGPLTKGKMGQ